MGYTFTGGPRGQKWEMFNFVSERAKGSLDLAMLISKFEVDNFEPGGAQWAGSWQDIDLAIRNKCDASNSKVGFLRMSCHGNVGYFRMGRSEFHMSNADRWGPVVARLAGYFVPGVSFVTIDSCLTGRGPEILKRFSQALGGVHVRAYEELQDQSTSPENGRGPFVTCQINTCKRTTSP